MRNQLQTFIKCLQQKGLPGNDDIVQIVLPLLEEVASFHEGGKVAPLQRLDTILITNDCLDIDERFIQPPVYNEKALTALQSDGSHAISITGGHTLVTDVDTGFTQLGNDALQQVREESEVKNPVYLSGYRSHELALDHHDALTDIFILGLITASVATGLDFYNEEEFNAFVSSRQHLQQLNASLHPSIAAVLVEMTELDRHRRAQDLGETIKRLKAFRDYNPEQAIDLTALSSYKAAPLPEKRRIVFQKLRSRLFDTSRRNRLLYFKSNMRFLNLTISSFPLSLNLAYVKPEHLFYWNGGIAEKVKKGSSLHLNKYLKTDEDGYILPSLDKIRLEMQKDIQEYGMSQARLAVAFLHWYNIKEDEKERITSPLILLPVSLQKKKSLRRDDDFIVDILSTEAEVNPILRFTLEETYNIKLPERIDLAEVELTHFYNQLQQAIEATHQGIQIALIDKPRIKLIHAVAQRTAAVYARRSRQRQRGLSHHHLLDYSYDQDNYQPLGLQMFRNYVLHQTPNLQNIFSGAVNPTTAALEQPKTQSYPQGAAKQEQYVHDEGTGNPYLWEFDLCHIVLGNFNYRKMSLVRDYNEVLESGGGQNIFQTLFSESVKGLQAEAAGQPSLHEQYTVIQADPTQLSSVLKSREGRSYIIQGPPGTGKSQTITNLIADYLSQGKNVLFVCEKKAAIDVVYHRLKSKGLHDLCCNIHDTQEDKKALIADLKTTYEHYLSTDDKAIETEAARKEAASALSAHIFVLQSLHELSATIHKEAGVPVYKLLNRLLELQATDEKEPATAAMVPYYNTWLQSGDTVTAIAKQLQQSGGPAALARHPARFLNTGIIKKEALSMAGVEERLRQLMALLQSLENIVPDGTTIGSLTALTTEALQLREYALNNNLFILDTADPRARQLDELIEKTEVAQRALAEAAEANKAWITRLPKQELETALPHIERLEHSFLKIFNGTWRSVSKAIKQHYDFAQHSIKPSYKTVVENLLKEYSLQEETAAARASLQKNFRIKDIDAEWKTINEYRLKNTTAWKQRLARWKEHPEELIALTEKAPDIRLTDTLLQEAWLQYSDKGLQTIEKEMSGLLAGLRQLPQLLHYLEQLETADPALKNIVRNETITPADLELQMITRTLQTLYQRYASVEKLNAALLEEVVSSIEKKYNELLALNVQYIKAVNHKAFRDKVSLAAQAAATLSAEQKEIRKVYTEGQKILEHEFSKSRRYKSIRELADGSAGVVLRDLKPVWLMSPLSVSDALPLADADFDVVIFDEASQITLEEGVPAMFRAPQSIIVGDEMQMPPTNFFGAGGHDPDDLTETADSEEEAIVLDADSLLTQGARKLDSVMLGWHYRSRSESLISFSNAAFYKGDLLTIPDRQQFDQAHGPIVVAKAEEAAANAALISNRSISYHYLPKGVYEDRGNEAEAAYIAGLIKALLQQKSGQTIGVVAFSMEQQGVIEDALYNLQKQDTAFDEAVEKEYSRTDEGQFTGLFIKNLENVQGDERDIIIISTCYGYNREGKMLMNFGPINRRGGEKRLNVIFSRAKQHVAVVSSIKFTDIKNEYNEGAGFFRRYLQYAELVSNGQMAAAAMVLKSINNRLAQLSAATADLLTVTQQVKAFLQNAGWQVAENVGQSVFKCSLAVKKSEDDAFRLGILIDDEAHYSNPDVLEQYVQRPAIMKSFNWNIFRLLTKDWLQERAGVEQQLLAALNHGGTK